MKDIIYRNLNKSQVNIEKDVFDYGWYAFKQYFIFLIIMIPLSACQAKLIISLNFVIISTVFFAVLYLITSLLYPKRGIL